MALHVLLSPLQSIWGMGRERLRVTPPPATRTPVLFMQRESGFLFFQQRWGGRAWLRIPRLVLKVGAERPLEGSPMRKGEKILEGHWLTVGGGGRGQPCWVL